MKRWVTALRKPGTSFPGNCLNLKFVPNVTPYFPPASDVDRLLLPAT